MGIKIIGICGGSCSGKTTLARAIETELGKEKCVIIFQDSFYKDQSDKFDRDGGQINFDHPDAIDFDLMKKLLVQLSAGQNIDLPQYDFKTHKRLKETLPIRPPENGIILVDGTLILHSKQLNNLFFKTIFLNTSEAVRFSRRKKRDVELRGRSLEGVIAQFENHVKPMHDQFVEPSKTGATLILDGLTEFDRAKIQVITWAK
jgi:uridine kinase